MDLGRQKTNDSDSLQATFYVYVWRTSFWPLLRYKGRTGQDNEYQLQESSREPISRPLTSALWSLVVAVDQSLRRRFEERLRFGGPC